MPTFTAEYLRVSIPHWERMFENLAWDAGTRKVAVEIGTYEGYSALWIAEHLLKAPDSELHCIDVWPPATREECYQRFLANVAESPHGGKIRHQRATSFAGLYRLLGQGVAADLVYVDGSHNAPEVLADMVLAFRLLRRGGVMICDDYTWADPKFGVGDLLGRPKLAIDAFTTIYARKIRLVNDLPLMQVAFTKLAN